MDWQEGPNASLKQKLDESLMSTFGLIAQRHEGAVTHLGYTCKYGPKCLQSRGHRMHRGYLHLTLLLWPGRAPTVEQFALIHKDINGRDPPPLQQQGPKISFHAAAWSHFYICQQGSKPSVLRTLLRYAELQAAHRIRSPACSAISLTPMGCFRVLNPKFWSCCHIVFALLRHYRQQVSGSNQWQRCTSPALHWV